MAVGFFSSVLSIPDELVFADLCPLPRQRKVYSVHGLRVRALPLGVRECPVPLNNHLGHNAGGKHQRVWRIFIPMNLQDKPPILSLFVFQWVQRRKHGGNESALI